MRMQFYAKYREHVNMVKQLAGMGLNRRRQPAAENLNSTNLKAF